MKVKHKLFDSILTVVTLMALIVPSISLASDAGHPSAEGLKS